MTKVVLGVTQVVLGCDTGGVGCDTGDAGCGVGQVTHTLPDQSNTHTTRPE